MSKYNEIVNKILEVEGGVFQNICDEILYLTENDCDRIFRPGSQVGTNKTKLGTPDSYYVLSDHQYVLVEYTTQNPIAIKSLVKKIKDDIDNCTDPTKTCLEPRDIHKLIYCCTADFSTAKHKELVSYARGKGIELDLRGIHAIVAKLAGVCAKVAKDYLQISIDTGQVLSPTVFAEEYYASGFSTPLTNVFFHRTREMESLLQSFNSEIKVTILTGPPGTGKSRLAMAAFQDLSNTNIQSLCISNKNAYIHDDLRVYLAKDCPYLILVDDANRQSGHLDTLLGILREKRSSKINVMITVRDYAFKDIMRRCAEFKPNVIRIEHFSDTELEGILSGKDFGIEGEVLERVLEISKGNARLSIISANVFLETGDFSKLEDVASIYDSYFQSAVGDVEIFSDIDLFRTLGLLSFFFAIDLNDKDFIAGLCSRFNINEYSLRGALIKLESLEIAESNEDLTIMKIADQVLGTYFFYRTFIKDEVLDFGNILIYYSLSHFGRIKDSINPASSTFSFENISSKIDPILSEYWTEINNQPKQAIVYLKLFWEFRKHELFGYVFRFIESSPKGHERYLMDEKSQSHIFKSDQYLELLNNFFQKDTIDIHSAIGLSLEYVRKFPEKFSQLVKSIRSEFAFAPSDLDSNCYRQLALLKHLIDGVNKDDLLCVATLLNVAHDILKSDSGIIHLRVDNNLMIQSDKILNSKNGLYHFRALIWDFIYNYAKVDFAKIQNFLLTYLDHYKQDALKVYHFDFYYLSKFIDTYFNKEQFVHCFIVRSLIDGFNREQLLEKKCKELEINYNCISYKYYRLLSWDKLRDSDIYNFKFRDHGEYRKIKEIEVINAFWFKTLEDFQDLYKIILEINQFDAIEFKGIHLSLNIILREMLVKDQELALNCITHIILTGNMIEVFPIEMYKIMWSQDNFADNLYNLIKSNNFKGKTKWLQSYMDYIPRERIRLEHTNDYLNLIESSTDDMDVNSNTLIHLEETRPDIFNQAIIRIASRLEILDVKLFLDDHLFKSCISKIDDIDLIKKVYIRQDRIQDHFDYGFKGLLKIIEKDPSFVMEFIRSIPLDYLEFSSTNYSDLTVIWNLEDAEKHMFEILDYLVNHPAFLSWQSPVQIFFSLLTDAQKEKASSFASSYLQKNAFDLDKVNMIMTLARNELSTYEEALLISWLERNPSFSDFKRIRWQNSTMHGGSGTVFNELYASRLQRVLQMLSGLGTNIYRYSEHKEYLSSKVAAYRREAIKERRHNFLYGD